MRCAIVLSDLGAGGTQRLALGLALHLRGRGLGVEVLTLDASGGDSFFPVPNGVGVTGLDLSAPSAHALGALRANLGRIRTLRRALAQVRPDLVVSFLTSTNILTLLAARPLGVPVIVAEESDPGHEPIPRAWALMRRLTYGRARHIVVHSQGAGAFFRGIAARRVRVIPNPVEPCPAAPVPDMPVEPRLPLVVAMGRLSPEKGFDLLLAAFAQVAPRRPDWSLTILGDGPLRPDLERQAAALGLADRVALPGSSRAPAETLRRASIFCSAARIEGFGIALCEAMACGLPVVATDAPSGPRDIIRPGIDGDLVPVDDTKALAVALSALMADPNRRRAYGDRAIEVTDRFSPTRVWAAWDALIDADTGNEP